MKIFELTTIFWKNCCKGSSSPLKSINKKQVWSVGFLGAMLLFYFSDHILELSKSGLEENALVMERYGNSLEANLNSISTDTMILQRERELVLAAIEQRIVAYLYQIPDYSYMDALEPYFRYAPEIVQQIPSAVPLEKGDYFLSSRFGIRQHPISREKRQHYGIDLAATSDKYVYASASGTISSITHDKNGYGTHIIIRHRFGFETLYGHLNKVLASKGRKVKQHELIGTVGNTGTSTGYHLHYEVIKSSKKIDPIPSLGLKYRVYMNSVH